MAPLAETAARRCFPIRPSVQMRERAVRELHGVPTSWISFVEGEGSARRSIGSVSVRASSFGGKHVRVAACVDPFGRIHSLPQGVGCERRRVHTPASRPMSVHAGRDESVVASSPAEPGALDAFVRTRLYRRLQISPRDVVHRPSGRARLGCNAKWRNTRRASPSRSAAEKGQGLFTGPKPRFGEEHVPSSREVTQTKSGVRVCRRSIVPRSVAGGSTERGWSFGSTGPGLETRAGGLARPSTSEVIIEALRCSPYLGEQTTSSRCAW